MFFFFISKFPVLNLSVYFFLFALHAWAPADRAYTVIKKNTPKKKQAKNKTKEKKTSRRAI